MQLDLPRLVVLVGPTAVGKTELAIQLARRLNGEIISADSRLFYRGMDIGTAKPSPIERQRIPHHLVDIAAPDEVISLAVFQQLADLAIHDINSRGRLPLLVGGTGQYIRAVIQGWSGPEVPPNPALRQALQNWGQAISAYSLHQRLASLDPQAAQGIDPRNVRRTVRALEVILISGRRFSEQRLAGAPRYQTFMVGLSRPRSELYARIDARIDQMLAGGLVAEVHDLMAAGFQPHTSALSAIGYRELCAYLNGEIALPEAVSQIKHKTRVLVRRQANWFKENDPQINWFPAGLDASRQIEEAIRTWIQHT